MQAVHVINPANLSIVKTITRDQDGNTLSNVGANGGGSNISRSWNDAVLARVRVRCAAGRSPRSCIQQHEEFKLHVKLLHTFCAVQDPNVNKSYLFVNEGDVYPGPGAQTHSYVTVIDTSTAMVSSANMLNLAE